MIDEPQLTGASPVGPGDVVADRYEIRDELGRGGYAIVYRAFDRESGEIVALKTIRPVAPRPQEVVARFRREAQLVSRLKHPNTVRVFDFGFEPELYLAMELLRGYALSDVLDGVNGLEPHRAVAIARGVLESLSEAHELEIVHRDLKPENVFLCQHPDGTETVKVLDFGIAKVLGFSDEEMHQPSLTLQGRAMGTPTYMSPEQARGASLTTRSDIYAVAVLLFEMLCGVPPYQGDGPMDVMLKHVNAEIPALTVPALRGTLIDRAVRKALAKKPEDRFETAWDFLAALGGVALRAPGIAPVAQKLPPAADSGPNRKTGKLAGTGPEAEAAQSLARSGINPEETDDTIVRPRTVEINPSAIKSDDDSDPTSEHEKAYSGSGPTAPQKAHEEQRPSTSGPVATASDSDAEEPTGEHRPASATPEPARELTAAGDHAEDSELPASSATQAPPEETEAPTVPVRTQPAGATRDTDDIPPVSTPDPPHAAVPASVARREDRTATFESASVDESDSVRRGIILAIAIIGAVVLGIFWLTTR